MKLIAIALFFFMGILPTAFAGQTSGHWEVSGRDNYFLRVRLVKDGELSSETAVLSNHGKWNRLLLEQRGEIAKRGAVLPIENSIWADLYAHNLPITGKLIVTLETKEGLILKMFERQDREINYSPLNEYDYLCENSSFGDYYDSSCEGYLSDSPDFISIMIGLN